MSENKEEHRDGKKYLEGLLRQLEGHHHHHHFGRECNLGFSYSSARNSLFTEYIGSHSYFFTLKCSLPQSNRDPTVQIFTPVKPLSTFFHLYKSA